MKNKHVKQAISDIKTSELFWGTAMHSELTETQIMKLYTTFNGVNVVREKDIHKDIKMFFACANWSKLKQIPKCYNIFGMRFAESYVRYLGNYFYMYFEVDSFINNTYIPRDEVKHLISVINARAEYLKTKETCGVLFAD